MNKKMVKIHVFFGKKNKKTQYFLKMKKKMRNFPIFLLKKLIILKNNIYFIFFLKKSVYFLDNNIIFYLISDPFFLTASYND